MSRLELFKPITLDYSKKARNLDICSKGQVKSTKYFPVFEFDGQEKIFKPLSRTKPLTTPLFAYSEVFWSHVTNRYFDETAPNYTLAYLPGLSLDQPKYYEEGTLVDSILTGKERLVNLLEFFDQYPDKNVDIHNYINFCMMNYDYTPIMKSSFVKEHYEVGKALAQQILLSMLRQDQNFHYENISFIFDGNEFVKVAPPIDAEFSTMFLYPDNERENTRTKMKYLNSLEISSKTSVLTKNIAYLVQYYPEVVKAFIDKFDQLIDYLVDFEFEDNYNYIHPCNSEYWKVGHALYKNGNLESAKRLEDKIKLIDINKERLFRIIITDVVVGIRKLNITLKTYLLAHQKGIDNLEDLNLIDLFKKLNIDILNDEEIIIDKIDLETNKIKLKS